MMLQVFVLLFLSFLMLFLAQLCHLYWTHHCLPHSKAVALHTAVQRLRHRHAPHAIVQPVASPPLSRQVWSQHLRLYAPGARSKAAEEHATRGNTDGFACPNHQCPYFGITDAHIHALVGDGKHGHAERIQTLRCQSCRTTFTARRHTPLYRLKTPSQQVAVVLTALGSWAGSFRR